MALESHARKAIAEPEDDVYSITSDERRGSNVHPLDHREGAVSAMAQLEVFAAAAEPPWPSPLHFPIREWRRFACYPNYLAAHIVAGLLENEGVPTVVESFGAFPGTDSSAVWVPKELLHRARWILALSPPTEAELLFLATGELQSAEEK